MADTISGRVASALLALALLFFGVSLGLGGYIFYERQGLDAQIATLKTRDKLQTELMQGDNRHALFPHADKRVGFVLNRNVVTTGLYAADGDKYPINDMGLRGNPIKPKEPGITRIALVSDSWFFGWRLTDNDRLQSQLKYLLSKYYPGKPYDVITVAVPGWNVENQAAFLEDYFDRIQPDILVWSINANDLWDTQSVIPPGVPATRPAPGNDRICPDTAFDWSLQPVPIVIERWRKNIALMAGISKAYSVPILALHVNELEPYVSMIRKVSQATFPIFSTPIEFTNDPRWQLQPGIDSHPTPWATRLIAVDVLGHLIEFGHLPPVDLSEYENSIIEKGQRASRGVSDDKVEAFINSTHGIPASYDRASQFHNPSITPKWEACPQGRITLGRAKGANTAELSFDEIRNETFGPNKLICTAHTNDGRSYKAEGINKDGLAKCSVSIPPSSTPEVTDLYWQFERFTCEVADDCFSARFHSARIF